MLLNIMSLLCSCPEAAAIPTITIDPCPENFGQVQKIVFQRVSDGAGTYNDMTEANAALKATWDALKIAAADTKAQGSPFVENPVFTPGDIREFGGGNETRGGRPIVLGSNPTQFTGVFNRANQSMIKTMKEMMCETRLGVFFINAQGKIAGDGVTSGSIRPFEIFSFFVGDKTIGGYDAPDQNVIQFWLPENWSDDFVIITPESTFEPLNDI